MIKKILCTALAFSFLFGTTAQAIVKEEITAKDVNENILDIYGFPDYYRYLSRDGAQRALRSVTSANGKDRYFVYGAEYGIKMRFNGFTEVQYLGHANEGGEFENPYFPWNAGWNGTTLDKMNYIGEPWRDPLTKDRASKGKFNNFESSSGVTLEDNIQKGLDRFFGGKYGKDWLPAGVSPANKDKLIYKTGQKHSSGRPWREFVYVTQPPSYQKWGTGIMYIKNASGSITYITVPIAPFELLEEPVSRDYRFTFSTFSKSEINASQPKYEFCYYMADFENAGMTEKFYVDLYYHDKDDWVNERYENFILELTPERPLDWHSFTVSATPIFAKMYRKDIQWDKWKDDENMHENLDGGYTKVINGETYYYYNTYYYKDGYRFVSKFDLAKIPSGNTAEFLNYLGFKDADSLQEAIWE